MREDTQKALKEYEISTFLFKSNIEEAEKIIQVDESVVLVLTTNFCITYPDPTKRTAFPGVVIVTDKRMLLYYKPLHEGISDITLLTDIKDIKLIKDAMSGINHIQVYVEDKIYDYTVAPKQKAFKLSSASSVDVAVNKIYRAFLFAKNPNGFEESASEKSESQSMDIPEQIEKLSVLKDKGIISEEEFKSKKAELLARL